MKNTYIFSGNGVIKAALIAAMCASPFAFGQATQSNNANLSTQDKMFLKEAAQGNKAEVELGNLAQTKGNNQDVKTFGKRMVTDHSNLQDKLQSLAQQVNYQLPTTTSSKAQTLNQKLSNMNGDQFDKTYITNMVQDHEHDIAAFQKEINQGSNQHVKDAASSALPTLQEHLKMAKDAAQKMGINVS